VPDERLRTSDIVVIIATVVALAALLAVCLAHLRRGGLDHADGAGVISGPTVQLRKSTDRTSSQLHTPGAASVTGSQ
jgi:hypothetical protein